MRRFGKGALCAILALDGLLIGGGALALRSAAADEGPSFQPRPAPAASSYPAARTARGGPLAISSAADQARLAACHIRKGLLRDRIADKGAKRVTLTALRLRSEPPLRASKPAKDCGQASSIPLHIEATLIIWRAERWIHEGEPLPSAFRKAEEALESGAKRARIILKAIPDHGFSILPSGFVASWLQESILYCESGGRYWLDHPGSSSASGGYGYLDGTWDFYGGFQSAYQAPPLVQDRRAEIDLRDGASEWYASRHCWG